MMSGQGVGHTYTVIKYIRHAHDYTNYIASQRCSIHTDVASANSALHKLYHSIYKLQGSNHWRRCRNGESGLFKYTYSRDYGNGGSTKIALSIERAEIKTAEPEPTSDSDTGSESDSESEMESSPQPGPRAQTQRGDDIGFRQGMKEAMKQEMWADLWDEIRRETLSDAGIMQAVMEEVREGIREAVREEEMDELREEVRAAVKEEEGERHRAELRRLFGGLRGSPLSRTPSIASTTMTPGSRPVGVQKRRTGNQI